MATESEILQNQLFGDKVSFINMPVFKDKIVIMVIEIDGEQHERFEEYKQRDIKKDKLLLENEWQVIRIKWKDCCNNPKETINLVRNKFIELQLF